ncbi:type IV toxin-antitoxin system AbiEi family antitoxin domain-containing protein [Cellulomonas composti]|nr:type IV toxin-antitoxin system AbiEi family antitoxin domain-containing protein [Cellulomonas composti]
MSDSLAALPAVRALPAAARAVAIRQDAVVTVAQLRAWGVGDTRVSRRVRAGDWQRPFRGVVVLQSGQVSWRQRAQAALLYAGAGAALSHGSAAFLHGIVDAPGRGIDVTVPHRRTVRRQVGLVVHRTRRMPWAGGRVRSVEPHEAVVGLVAATSGTDELVGLICSAVRAGVSPGLLVETVRDRRLPNRRLVLDLLDQVADGIESPLEHRYQRDVERAHGLPRAAAQQRERVGGRWIRADRIYVGFGVRAELDGQLAHPFGTTDADVWRDNAVLLERGDLTLRYRWQHVAVTPCATAAQVASALVAHGWTSTPRPCGPRCTLTAP